MNQDEALHQILVAVICAEMDAGSSPQRVESQSVIAAKAFVVGLAAFDIANSTRFELSRSANLSIVPNTPNPL